MTTTNTEALLAARLFEKGVKDALVGMTAAVTVSRTAFQAVGHRWPSGTIIIVIEATKLYATETLRVRTEIDAEMLGAMKVDHFKHGKDIGFKLAQEMLNAICERQPQEITLSIKDVSKARDLDHKCSPGPTIRW